MLLALADRWHKFPAEVLEQDASLLRMVKIEALGRPPEPPYASDAGQSGAW